jgi:uncharacterized repeat protein (TIGR01451 family)
MKIFSNLRVFALLALGLMVAGIRAEAQFVGLSVVASPSPVGISNNLTYTITVTNLSLSGISENFYITNTLPASAQFQGVNNPYGPCITNGNTIIFIVQSPIIFGGWVTVNVTALPTTAGLITDSVIVISGDYLYSASSNVVTQVTNAVVVPQADLAVAMTGPAALVFANDWMVYGVSVTNLGPDDASGIFLTNTLPPGVGFKSVSPSNHSYAVSIQSSNVIFNLGTLTNQAFINLQLTVQPTNAGTLTFVSVVSTNGIFDPNPANDSASLSVGVSNFLSSPGQLTATIVSTQQFNQLSGRLEQNIVLSNAGPTSVDSARVIVTGLTNRLSNAVGTNNGNPYVTYASALTNGQGGANLLLQFYPSQSAFPFTNSQMQAEGVTLPNLVPVTNGFTPTNITLLIKLPSGGMLLAFPSLTNRTYTVEYTTNLLSPIWLAAQPLTVTPANYTYWIDYGPPETVSHPTNTPVRFYRVFLNP